MRRGFTLIEMLVYVAILSIIISALMSTMAVITRLYRQVSVNRSIESSALLALDHISEVVRSSESIDAGQSILGSNPGTLALNARTPAGVAYTALIYPQGGVLKLSENGVYQGQLTASSSYVSSIIFRHIDTSVSDAVRVELTLTASSSDYSKTETFYTTTILKNSY